LHSPAGYALIVTYEVAPSSTHWLFCRRADSTVVMGPLPTVPAIVHQDQLVWRLAFFFGLKKAHAAEPTKRHVVINNRASPKK